MAVTIPGENPYSDAYVIEYPDGDVSVERSSSIVSFERMVHTVKEGETIQSIAFQYYGDSGLWAVIADANNILNPFEEVITDMELIIPVYGR